METTKRSETESVKGFSRRQFLKVAGAGAAHVGAKSGLAAIAGQSLLTPESAHARALTPPPIPRTLGGSCFNLQTSTTPTLQQSPRSRQGSCTSASGR